MPGYESVALAGLFAPGKTPPAIVNRRNSDLTDKADGVLYTSFYNVIHDATGKVIGLSGIDFDSRQIQAVVGSEAVSAIAKRASRPPVECPTT